MQIVFLHGLETGPHGSKYQALRLMFGEVISPDCEGVKEPQQRLAIIQQTLSDQTGPFLVVGSSAGGLMALLLQREDPRVKGLVLCAPALHTEHGDTLTAEGLPDTVIIHGRGDDVVPIECSREFGAPLVEVDDDHRLNDSLPLMLRLVFEMKLKAQFPSKQ